MEIQRKSNFGKCLILLTFCTIALSQEECNPQKLICPLIETVEAIDMAAINGRWYEHSNTYNSRRKCTQFMFQPNITDTEYIELTELEPERSCKQLGSTAHPELGCDDERRKYLLVVDYASFAIWYTCGTHYSDPNLNDTLAILTRQYKPAQETLDTIKELIAEYGFSELKLYEVDQDNCTAT